MLSQINTVNHGLVDADRVGISDERVDSVFAAQTLEKALMCSTGAHLIVGQSVAVRHTGERKDCVCDTMLGDENILSTPQKGVLTSGSCHGVSLSPLSVVSGGENTL